MRIAVGGIEHESCGFAVSTGGSGEPTLEDAARTILRGPELERLGDNNTIVDGFVRGVRQCGMELVPLVWFDATSGPPPSRASYDRISGELLDRLRRALPVDGVLLSLHGSFAAEGIDDADGAILTAVREVVGPHCPVTAVHDMHCNLTREMSDAADMLVVERTYPHVDMAERAVHAARIMHRTVRGAVRPTMSVRLLPLLWSASRMIDAEAPMSDAVAQLRAMDELPGVLSCSIGVGYQWIDSPVVGAAVVVVTDGNAAQAQEYADQLGSWVWDRRELFQGAPLPATTAIAQGEAIGKFPIVLAEQGDNTGGGAAGDATEMLRTFIDRRMTPSAVLYMVDPAVATAAIAAGTGADIDVQVGGRSQPIAGPPVPMRARVRAVSDGKCRYDGPMWAGVEADFGPSAWIEQDGIHVVVISRRIQPIDLAFCRSLGLDCRQMRYLCVKSTGHFRSGFGPIAGSVFNVDTASALSHDFRRLPYTRLGRRMYPLHPEADRGY